MYQPIINSLVQQFSENIYGINFISTTKDQNYKFKAV